MLSAEQKAFYEREGYLIVRRLFSREEVESYIDHYMRLREAGTYPGDFAGIDIGSKDPLKRYPRMIHMHRWDEVSKRWMLDDRLCQVLSCAVGALLPPRCL